MNTDILLAFAGFLGFMRPPPIHPPPEDPPGWDEGWGLSEEAGGCSLPTLVVEEEPHHEEPEDTPPRGAE